MHELGVLRYIVKQVANISEKNKISNLKFIKLEIGESSGYVPYYLRKLFPIAANDYAIMDNTELLIELIPGNGLIIKEIGY